MINFPSLYAFREAYIIPLTRIFPRAKNIDLALLMGNDVFRRGFESSYDSIFVKGCHILRIPRAAGIETFLETKERIMFRNLLIKDLWEILGSLFSFLNACLLVSIITFNYYISTSIVSVPISVTIMLSL